jgi:hypothetical protein
MFIRLKLYSITDIERMRSSMSIMKYLLFGLCMSENVLNIGVKRGQNSHRGSFVLLLACGTRLVMEEHEAHMVPRTGSHNKLPMEDVLWNSVLPGYSYMLRICRYVSHCLFFWWWIQKEWTKVRLTTLVWPSVCRGKVHKSNR